MANLTPNDLQRLDTADLLTKAEAIRDAVEAKSVSARQVGQLFASLVEACGDINKAVGLFLSTNVPEIQNDIDQRLTGATTEATNKVAAEIQKSESARARVEALIAQLSGQSLSRPLRIDITSTPVLITLRNRVPQHIDARLFPRFSLGSVLFIGDHQAVNVTPDGNVTPVRLGKSNINAVATSDTAIYNTLCIEVVPPRCRLSTTGALRLDSKGNIRLT